MAEEKSDSSSFEDLAAAPDFQRDSLDEVPLPEDEQEWMDVLGSGNLLRKIIRKGTDDLKPQRGDVCLLNYVGKLKNGKVIEQQRNYEVQLGDGEVIQGLDLVLALMHEGETSLIKMTPRFGYGECGLAPNIPPNADLEYTLELVKFKEEPELEMLSIRERKLIGNKKRERGNWWYTMQEPTLAIQCYRKALEYLDESKGGITDPTPSGELPPTPEDLMSLIEDRMKTYNNMAAAQMKQGIYDVALTSVETVLTCQPNNVKALFRKGKILSYQNKVSDALISIRAAYALAPEDRAIKTELAKLEEREVKDIKKERDLARKMLGGHKTPESNKAAPDKDKPKKKGGKKILVWSSVVFSIAIGVISVALYRYKFV